MGLEWKLTFSRYKLVNRPKGYNTRVRQEQGPETDSILSAELGLSSHLEDLIWGYFSYLPLPLGSLLPGSFLSLLCGVCILSCVPLFCDPLDGSLPGSSLHGILQARILEWVVISFSRGSSWPKDQTHDSCIGKWILYHWATGEAPPNKYQERMKVTIRESQRRYRWPSLGRNREGFLN